jgi:hypothetical protein
MSPPVSSRRLQLLVLLPSLLLAACGSSQTCVQSRIAYAGAATGAVFVRVVYTDPQGQFAGSGGEQFPSVAIAVSQRPPGATSGGGSCWSSSIARNELAQATAWIDVGGRFLAGCGASDCAPQPSDPVGHAASSIRDFEQNDLLITVRDP